MQEPSKIEKKIIGVEDIVIPECCRLGLETCIHATPLPKKEKRNIAL